jgi:hypothetical protein
MKTLINYIFRDKNNRIVIGQFPNIPIIGWFVFMLISQILDDGKLKTNLELISMAFLFTWAYLELFQGVNRFRRFLGFIVLLVIIISIILR